MECLLFFSPRREKNKRETQMLRSYCYSHDKTFVQILSTELLSSWQRWSLGVLGFELLTGSTPFAVASGSSGNGREKRTGTELRILKEDPAIPKGMSPEVESLLRELLLKDPTQRLGSKGGTSYVYIRSCHQVFPSHSLLSKVTTIVYVQRPSTFRGVTNQESSGLRGL